MNACSALAAGGGKAFDATQDSAILGDYRIALRDTASGLKSGPVIADVALRFPPPDWQPPRYWRPPARLIGTADVWRASQGWDTTGTSRTDVVLRGEILYIGSYNADLGGTDNLRIERFDEKHFWGRWQEVCGCIRFDPEKHVEIPLGAGDFCAVRREGA